MKTLIVIALLVLPFSTFARDFDELTIETVPRIKQLQKKCDSKTPELNGCFVRGTNTVYVRKSLDSKFYLMVMLHEIGHFYTADFELRELRKTFPRTRKSPREVVADDFALWMTAPYLLSDAKVAFFESLGVDKEGVMQAVKDHWK